MTQKETLEQIRGALMSGRYNPETGEYRVTYPAQDMKDAPRREEVAYYTTDAADAITSARAMRAELLNNNVEGARWKFPLEHDQVEADFAEQRARRATIEQTGEAERVAAALVIADAIGRGGGDMGALVEGALRSTALPHDERRAGYVSEALDHVKGEAASWGIEDTAAALREAAFVALDFFERGNLNAAHTADIVLDGCAHGYASQFNEAAARAVPDQIERPEGDGVAKHVAGIAKMKADTFEDHVWDAVIKDADEFLAALPSYQIATHAADAITALASILPDAERQPLHRDYEPTDADETRHAMTGEEPAPQLSPFEKAATRAKEKAAAAKPSTPTRGFGFDL